MLNHWASHFTPNRITISAVNVDHEHLVSLYQNGEFPHSAEAPHHARARRPLPLDKDEGLQFIPGRQSIEVEARSKATGVSPDMPTEIISAFGWPTAGRDGSLADYAAAVVANETLSIALADGIQYDRHINHKGIRTFYRPYSSAGLLGFTVRADPAGINKNILDGLTILKEIGTANLDAAKAGAAVAFHNENIDTVRDYCNFLGTSFLKGEQRLKPEDIFAAISSVSAADIKRVQDFAKEARPTMWVTGETFGVPSLRKMGY
eukprot:GILJ01028845.1.p1 GENE.GILJ01028845.1~~GILJ01028845.1.p1  ORF type:complete len:263 (-),score=59.45 GILJ01028845.1:293-1081(-)